MSKDAGATVDRGVFTAGALYEKGNFSIGGIDYYCADVINIGYAEATLKVPINDDWQPKFAAQFVDQRSVGSDSLTGDGFSGQQFGLKAELPVKKALFTTAFTHTTGGPTCGTPGAAIPVIPASRFKTSTGPGRMRFSCGLAMSLRNQRSQHLCAGGAWHESRTKRGSIGRTSMI